MKNIIPTIIPAPPRVHRKRRVIVPAASGTVTVIEVDELGETQLLWFFSVDMQLPLAGNVLQLEAMDNHGSGWVSPTATNPADPNSLVADYAGTNFDDGFSWRIIVTPVGLNFVGGQTLIVPEEG